jgi:hypothetical protein
MRRLVLPRMPRWTTGGVCQMEDIYRRVIRSVGFSPKGVSAGDPGKGPTPGLSSARARPAVTPTRSPCPRHPAPPVSERANPDEQRTDLGRPRTRTIARSQAAQAPDPPGVAGDGRSRTPGARSDRRPAVAGRRPGRRTAAPGVPRRPGSVLRRLGGHRRRPPALPRPAGTGHLLDLPAAPGPRGGVPPGIRTAITTVAPPARAGSRCRSDNRPRDEGCR